uniref:Chemokine interleukin-8-like domain-containing protein n=1 Tax=Mola mola TaxID=94237 RepID=A0A3Q4BX46_MOLML
MKFQALFFLLFFTCMYLTLAQGSYGNCCLGYNSPLRSNAKRHTESYWRQETDGDCNIRAVVFVVKKRTKKWTICSNPGEAWVQQLIETVDSRTAKQI